MPADVVEDVVADKGAAITDEAVQADPVEWPDGSVYDGDWLDGQRDGTGLYTWKSGSSYAGEWSGGKRQGKGVYTWADGSKYNGSWGNDKPSGVGVFTWASGSVYEGEWTDGKREGKGVYRWKDGSVFEGLWQNDVQVDEIDDTKTGGNDSDYVKSSGKSTLWRIKGEKNEVYLLGSIHLLKKEHYPLKPAVMEALEKSQVVVFEVDPALLQSTEAQKLILSSAALPAGQTLQGSVSKESFEKLKLEFGNLGLHVGAVNGFKPWFAAITLVALKMQRMGYDPEQGVEMYLHRKAKEQGKEIASLETLEFQVGLFNKLDEKHSDAVLMQTLDDLAVMEEEINKIVECWKSGNEEGLAKLLLKSFSEYPEVQKMIVDDRNVNWVTSIEKYLTSEKNYMIVGGAFHFPGKNGVLSLLKAHNHRLEQL
jgi:uncharacterized protein YbaP (TraB family)